MVIERLEDWSKTANQIDKNAVYRALFAISNGSVFRTHTVFNDAERKQDYLVLVRDDLIIKVRLRHSDSFGIVYIGAPVEPADRDLWPRLDLGA